MVPDLPDCSLKVEDETQTDFTDQEAYLREIIDNNNKKIHKLEQEIEELKRQLQDTQRQRDAFNKRLFNFENCSQKIPMLLFILDFKARRLKWLLWSIFIICYWRSKTDNITESDYSESRLLTKKGRARSLRPLDEFFIVMCRLRQGFLEDYLAQLFNVSASTVSRIFVTWVNFVSFKFGQINIWPTRKVIDTMPKSFKGRYKST